VVVDNFAEKLEGPIRKPKTRKTNCPRLPRKKIESPVIRVDIKTGRILASRLDELWDGRIGGRYTHD